MSSLGWKELCPRNVHFLPLAVSGVTTASLNGEIHVVDISSSAR